LSTARLLLDRIGESGAGAGFSLFAPASCSARAAGFVSVFSGFRFLVIGPPFVAGRHRVAEHAHAAPSPR
jgi:hypothetical protein